VASVRESEGGRLHYPVNGRQPDPPAAQATLRQSQDILRAGYGVFIPQIGATSGVSRQTSNLRLIGSTAPNTVFISYLIGNRQLHTRHLGRPAAAGRGAASPDGGAAIQRHGTYIMLAGNVVNTAIAQAAYRAQIRATEDLIVLEKEQVSITRAQAESGTVPFSNVLSLQERAREHPSHTSAASAEDRSGQPPARDAARACTGGLFFSFRRTGVGESRTSSSRRTCPSRCHRSWCTSVLTFFRQSPAHQCQRADRCRHGSHVFPV